MYFIIFFPPFAALIGWIVFKIFTILLKQNFYKQKGTFAKQIGLAVKEQNLAAELANAINPDMMKKWEPTIREQIADYLVNKLPQKMPAFAMFTGDKIVAIATDSATEEIMTAVPNMAQEYTKKELNNETIAAKVEARIQNIEPRTWDAMIDRFVDPLLSKIQIAGSILGFVLGLAYILFMFIYGYIFAS